MKDIVSKNLVRRATLKFHDNIITKGQRLTLDEISKLNKNWKKDYMGIVEKEDQNVVNIIEKGLKDVRFSINHYKEIQNGIREMMMSK